MNGPRPRPPGSSVSRFQHASFHLNDTRGCHCTYLYSYYTDANPGRNKGQPARKGNNCTSNYGNHIVLYLDRPARIRTATAAAERGSQRISQPYRDAHMQLTSIAKSAQGGTAGLALDRPQVPEPGPSSTAMTRHAAHDAPFPFLLWHSRCQDASVMAAHTRLRTVCCRRAAVSRRCFVEMRCCVLYAGYCVVGRRRCIAPPFRYFHRLFFLNVNVFFFFAAASHQLMQPLSRPEPLAAKGTNLLQKYCNNTAYEYSSGLFLALSYIRSANFTDAIRFRRWDCLFYCSCFFKFSQLVLRRLPSLISYCRSQDWL